MIAGAASNVPAMAYSGPGPVLGRRKYVDSIQLACPECVLDRSPEATDRHAFNVVPLGDIVPVIGGQPLRATDISCDASLAACHSVLRSMCTIMESCGDPWGRSLFQYEQSFGEPLESFGDCCVHGTYGRGDEDCKALLCGELEDRPDIDTDLRRFCE